jgi:DNA polymerase-1
MNFQNIPRSNKLIKRAIVPKLDTLAMFDYEQIEYRLLAYYMNVALEDSRMADNFRAGIDAHTSLAKLLMDYLKVKYTEPLTDEQRQVYGKTPNFAIVYAGGKPTIKRQLAKAGIPCDDKKAKQILDAIRGTMPGVRSLMDMLTEEARMKGYVFDIFGRHYRPDYTMPYNDAVRKLLNALLQGGAAGLTREAVVKVAYGCRDLGLKSHIVNVVHDEIIMDCPADELPVLAEHVPTWMGNETVEPVVPVTVGMEVAYENWADKEEYDADVLARRLEVVRGQPQW